MNTTMIQWRRPTAHYGSIPQVDDPYDVGGVPDDETTAASPSPHRLRFFGQIAACAAFLTAVVGGCWLVVVSGGERNSSRRGDGGLILSPPGAESSSSSSSSIVLRGGGGGETLGAPVTSGSSGKPPRSRPPTIPFERVDRTEYSSLAASDVIDPTLFDPSLLRRTTTNDDGGGTNARGLLRVPFPTGAFWTNLVLTHTTSDGGFSFPIMSYPYGYRWSSGHVEVSYPPLRRLMDAISIRDIFNPDLTLGTVEPTSARAVTAFDPLSVTLRYWTDGEGGDEDGNGEGGGDDGEESAATTVSSVEEEEDEEEGAPPPHWELYLVQGSPYVTARYERSTPVIKALSIFDEIACPPDELGVGGDDEEAAACTTVVEGDGSEQHFRPPPETITLKGVRFLVHTRENLTWMVFASEPITLSFDNIRKTTVSSIGAYSGVLRLTIVPPPRDELVEFTSRFPDSYKSVDVSSSSGVRRLACHARVYPVGGAVTWDFPKEEEDGDDDVATVHFRYDTRTMDGSDGDAGVASTPQTDGEDCDGRDLLMLALPHHVQVLTSNGLLTSVDDFDLTFLSIKGAMVPVLGDEWSYKERLTSIGFDSESSMKNAAALDDVSRGTILSQVKEDMTRVLPTLDENVYGFGKQIARLAQLAHIADVLEVGEEGRGHKDSAASLTHVITEVLHRFLSEFLLSHNRDSLLFDANFGGIVSKDGLENSEGDFGNGWFNDHLFHYGYIIYACSILGKLNATFVSEHGPAVDALLFDVAYDSNADSEQDPDTIPYFFPLARHKSWFDSHSFASGLFPFADGKSLESSGEAVNCYYASYLWSLVRWGEHSYDHDSKKVDFARLLLATEIRGVKTYWHMISPDEDADNFHVTDIYSSTFAKNLMVGNVGMMDVTVATWFGTKMLYVHMINFLPITAVTRELFEKRYIEEEFSNVIEPVYADVEMAWRGYVICDRAMIDPVGAWSDAMKLRSYELDQAISQSQVLYFIATSDGFVATSNHDGSQGDTTNALPPKQPSDTSALCEEHNACAALGLVGSCCPALDGVYLGCCNSPKGSDEIKNVLPAKDTSGGPASCAENDECAALGLTGSCCPTANGVRLGCCTSGQD